MTNTLSLEARAALANLPLSELETRVVATQKINPFKVGCPYQAWAGRLPNIKLTRDPETLRDERARWAEFLGYCRADVDNLRTPGVIYPKPLAADIAKACGRTVEPIDYLTQSLRELVL